jgi:hypothetical protein
MSVGISARAMLAQTMMALAMLASGTMVTRARWLDQGLDATVAIPEAGAAERAPGVRL